jgi:hypothetical protein
MIARLGLLAAVGARRRDRVRRGARGLGGVVGGIGSSLGGFVDNVTSTPSPRASVFALTLAPTLKQPTEPYTSQSMVDLEVSVPQGLEGDPNHRIHVYHLPGQDPALIQEAPIADAPRTVIPVQLTDGINDFTAKIAGPWRSDPSLVVRYVFDNVPPKITISSPKNNAIVNGKAVDIKGKTQARTTLLAHNAANGSSIAGTAESDGTFTLSLALSAGANKITIDGTDPAGNASEVILTVKRGAGKLAVALSASDYQIKRSQLPEPVTLFATVTDPNGQPLAGAAVTFTLSMPGIPTVTIDGSTDAQGKASFKTTIPKGAAVGQGSATVLVSTDAFGSTQDFTVITITR